jgi:hypothetical protein
MKGRGEGIFSLAGKTDPSTDPKKDYFFDNIGPADHVQRR